MFADVNDASSANKKQTSKQVSIKFDSCTPNSTEINIFRN